MAWHLVVVSDRVGVCVYVDATILSVNIVKSKKSVYIFLGKIKKSNSHAERPSLVIRALSLSHEGAIQR